MFPDDINEQQKIRHKKTEELRSLGIDPFGKRFERTHVTKDIFDLWGSLDHDALEKLNQTVKIAGRIVLKWPQGKAGFMHLQDREGRMQVYVRLDSVGACDFNLFKQADLGDIVGVEGALFRTKTNELTIKASKYTHLTKALRPLPDKWHGLQDKEEARRRRYVDLIVSDEARKVALLRPRIIRAFQNFFDARGYIE